MESIIFAKSVNFEELITEKAGEICIELFSSVNQREELMAVLWGSNKKNLLLNQLLG